MRRFLLEILSQLSDRDKSDSGSGYDRLFTWLLRILQTVAAILGILRFFD